MGILSPVSPWMVVLSDQVFHILLVDDSAADRALVRHHLTGRLDFEMSEADSLEQYVEYLSRGDWDLIITDNVMVGFSGMEAIDLARQRGLETPFILLTGQGTEEVAIEAMRRCG